MLFITGLFLLKVIAIGRPGACWKNTLFVCVGVLLGVEVSPRAYFL